MHVSDGIANAAGIGKFEMRWLIRALVGGYAGRPISKKARVVAEVGKSEPLDAPTWSAGPR
jgi:hypothetical protein